MSFLCQMFDCSISFSCGSLSSHAKNNWMYIMGHTELKCPVMQTPTKPLSSVDFFLLFVHFWMESGRRDEKCHSSNWHLRLHWMYARWKIYTKYGRSRSRSSDVYRSTIIWWTEKVVLSTVEWRISEDSKPRASHFVNGVRSISRNQGSSVHFLSASFKYSLYHWSKGVVIQTKEKTKVLLSLRKLIC